METRGAQFTNIPEIRSLRMRWLWMTGVGAGGSCTACKEKMTKPDQTSFRRSQMAIGLIKLLLCHNNFEGFFVGIRPIVGLSNCLFLDCFCLLLSFYIPHVMENHLHKYFEYLVHPPSYLLAS